MNSDSEARRTGIANEDGSWFFSSVASGRARRPLDIALTLIGALLVAITSRGVEQLDWAEDLSSELVDLIPQWAATFLALLYAVGLVYAALIIVMALLSWSTRKALVRDLLLALGLTAAASIAIAYSVDGTFPLIVPEFYSGGEVAYPVVRVATVTAMLVVAGPALVRPLRRMGWWIVASMGLVAMALRYGLFIDSLGGLGIGLMCAGGVLWVFGSPRALPEPSDVDSGLAKLGLDAADVSATDDQSWGAREFTANVSSSPTLVRVYGRDAKDAQLVNRWWRSLWYRDAGPKLTSSRLHLVEHEALMTLAAQRRGLAVQDVLAFGEPNPKTALIAVSAIGQVLESIPPDDVSDEALVDMWRSVDRLHEEGISHGRLNTRAVSIDENRAILGRFHAASMAAPANRIHADVTELIASTAATFGVDRAVRVARVGLGDDALADALPYVQRSAVSTEGRKDLPAKKSFFAEVRSEIAGQLGVDEPEPVQLTRINWRTILMFALTLTAAYALIGMLGGIAWSDVWAELQDATWSWIVVGLIVATATLITDAYSLMAAVSAPVPLQPAAQLQSAIKFIQLAVGGAAGRMATNITFLRKFGVDSTDAVTQGGVDSFTGFVVQIATLLVALVFGNVDLIPDDASVDIDWLLVFGILGFAFLVSYIVWRTVPAIREKIVPAFKQMWAGLKELGHDPSRLVQMFGANFGSQFLFTLSLWLTALAFGWTLPFLSVMVVYVVMALFSGLMPIPGGVGVSEAALTAGLVSLGVDQSTAFAIAVTFRVSSAYLPPVWGFFSVQWLQRNEYL